jgi:hypothetical protein
MRPRGHGVAEIRAKHCTCDKFGVALTIRSGILAFELSSFTREIRIMRSFVRTGLAALAIVGFAYAATGDASAQAKSGVCVNKAAQGTNNTQDGAMFQAWEAVLQATDWGSWSSFMASGAKIGTAPGYKVSNVKSKCAKGGLGFECVMQARLCK